ncbi:hypothetical protein ACQEU8_14880 [Streptomyces sp. CA-250714]|uniref:hypothetical protein n=1 Tax=Streptomyces sp. CA-250714 TaxID=3240060 RepID=UPI003D8E4FF1
MSNSTVTYRWTVKVLTSSGPQLIQHTYAGHTTGPAGYSVQDARRDVYAWLRGQGVKGYFANFYATAS